MINPNLGVDLSSKKNIYQGDMGLTSGKENVRDAVLRRLDTPQGSLFAHPDYGNLIWDLLSENVNNAWAGKAETAIRECLNQEPRISVDSIQISIYPEARRVVADIYYQVKDVPGVENLVWSVAT